MCTSSRKALKWEIGQSVDAHSNLIVSEGQLRIPARISLFAFKALAWVLPFTFLIEFIVILSGGHPESIPAFFIIISTVVVHTICIGPACVVGVIAVDGVPALVIVILAWGYNVTFIAIPEVIPACIIILSTVV